MARGGRYDLSIHQHTTETTIVRAVAFFATQLHSVVPWAAPIPERRSDTAAHRATDSSPHATSRNAL